VAFLTPVLWHFKFQDRTSLGIPLSKYSKIEVHRQSLIDLLQLLLTPAERTKRYLSRLSWGV